MPHPGTAAATVELLRDFARRYLDQGRLGVKSQRGFYSYPRPDYQQPGFVEGNVER